MDRYRDGQINPCDLHGFSQGGERGRGRGREGEGKWEGKKGEEAGRRVKIKLRKVKK